MGSNRPPSSDQIQHAGAVSTHPDGDLPLGHWAGVDPVQPIVPPLVLESPLSAPEEADDGQGFLQGLHRLGAPAPRTAHPLYRIPEAPGAEAELEAPSAGQIHRGGRLGDHGRRTEGEVGHVGKEPDPAGMGDEQGEQGEGVQKATLVGMILDAEIVEPHLLRQPGLAKQLRELIGLRNQKESEPHRSPVVHVTHIDFCSAIVR
jgi:hypothetical protein